MAATEEVMNRREIVYDLFIGEESQPVCRAVSRDEALAARDLIQDVRIEPRIVPDPDFDPSEADDRKE